MSGDLDVQARRAATAARTSVARAAADAVQRQAPSHRPRTGRLAALVAAVVVLLGVAAFAANDGDTTVTTGSPDPAADAAFALRPVIAESNAPCGPPSGVAELVLPDPADPGRCLELGAVGLDSSAVDAARLQPRMAGTVVVLLTAEGSRSFSQLAGPLLGKRLAIVVGGRVASAPTLHITDTSVVEVSGLDGREAAELLRRFGDDATPPTT